MHKLIFHSYNKFDIERQDSQMFQNENFDLGNWTPLDQEKSQAPIEKPQTIISKGNLAQVPDFVSIFPYDSFMEQILNLETSERKYNQMQQPQQGPLDEYFNQMESLEFEPLPMFVGQLPQQPQEYENPLEGIFDKKIFNNMPGFTIGAIQSLRNYIQFDVVSTFKIGIMLKVKKCCEKLFNDILMKLSSKQGNREQLRMVFNDVDEKFTQMLKKKINKNRQIKKYFELLKEFGAEVMNEAKRELREAVHKYMTKSWMSEHAENRRFSGNNVEMKKNVFYKYMTHFAQELYKGQAMPLIDREKVLSIHLFQN